MENKMDNELDFSVGDVVCDIRYGTGVVEELEINSEWPVYVDFGGDDPDVCRCDGKASNGDKHRALYHGTWEQVFGNLPDLKPKRKVKRWVNLYANGEWELYDSKEKARNFLGINPSKSVAVAVEIEVDE